jgi:hypothetical protein
VYDDKALSMAELMEALDSNFEGTREKKYVSCGLAAPKFGNE